MYARLPFDDPAVLSSHEPGVKKRLKGDDLKAFERWLAMAPGRAESGVSVLRGEDEVKSPVHGRESGGLEAA